MRNVFPIGWSAAAVLAALVLASGCSGTQPAALERDLPEAFPNHTLGQIRHNIAASTDTLRAFEASARMTVETPDRGGRFSAEIHQRRDDSLLVSISPGLGIVAARALVTPDSFFVYDRIHNHLTYGAIDEAAARLPAPLLTGSVFENLTGIVVPEPGVAWEVTADSARYVLRSPDGLRTYVVDPSLWRVTHYVQRAPDGTLVEERRFSRFDTFGGIVLPRRVVLRHPTEEAMARIYYRDLTLNPASLSFEFDVPATARRELVSARTDFDE